MTRSGRDVTNLPMYRRAREGISYLPQEPSVFRKMTVEENLFAILETLDLTRATIAEARRFPDLSRNVHDAARDRARVARANLRPPALDRLY